MRAPVALLLGATAMAATLYALRPQTPPPAAAISVSSALGAAADAGFLRAEAPRPFAFPADHGPHPGYRNEWWYFTGHLRDAAGREYGYQLTLFRIAFAPGAPPDDSAWRTHTFYMGHLALTDVAAGRHRAVERFARAALGLAGAGSAPPRVWLERWEARLTDAARGTWHLTAQDDDIGLDLELVPAKAPVPQGEAGLSRKGAAPGNASYYYSVTRLASRGELRVDGRSFAVDGASWLDREWSTSALGPEQSGWDWFAVQLDDGRELMFYRLRRRDGSLDPHSAGTLVAADGTHTPLAAGAVELTPEGRWSSPASGDTYPARWRLRIPAAALELQLTPKVADQEMRLSVRYWEGAARVEGRDARGPVRGQAYVEMTRYAE